jgi:protein-disulfide isomerase
MLKEPVSRDDWTLGPADAPVTLVEYGDFQCPHCQRAHAVVEGILGRFGAQLRFAFRHLPITSLHQQAMAAALAAEAAGRQGKFWEMQRRLMRARGKLDPEQLVGYAREAGLDVARWERDRADPVLRKKVEHQKLVGVRSGVNGTPTFYVNGERFDGEIEGELETLIERTLEPSAPR